MSTLPVRKSCKFNSSFVTTLILPFEWDLKSNPLFDCFKNFALKALTSSRITVSWPISYRSLALFLCTTCSSREQRVSALVVGPSSALVTPRASSKINSPRAFEVLIKADFLFLYAVLKIS